MKKSIALVDCRIPRDMEMRLWALGFKTITLPPHPSLSTPIASHTDMLVARIGNEYITCADYCDVAPYVFTDLYDEVRKKGARISFTSDELKGEYPLDARLNVLVMGENIFLREESVSSYIINAARACGMTIRSVKQGYPACTVLRIDDTHAITADHGMARAMRDVGISVTLIDNGDISLPPYEYGFIGGCAGVCDGVAYFLGDPKTHRDYGKISAALDECGVRAVSLGGGGLIDLGGILFA